MHGEDDGNKPQVKRGKGSAKKWNGKQKAQPLNRDGSQWSTKHIVGGLLGIICFIVVCAAVVQRRSGVTEGNYPYHFLVQC